MDAPAVMLLDIEGTISPIAFVHETMFPYARERLDRFLEAHGDEPAVQAARAQIAADAQTGPMERAALVAHLRDLMDRDAKSTGLKQLQGLIWESGFATGVLRSPLFDDVPDALRRWTAAGRRVAIYSSGSVAAQRLFLRHTTHGDLSSLISAYFDTTSGPKQSTESYRGIADQLGLAAGRVLFASDVVAELDAAAAAGMQARLLLRPGNKPQPPSAHVALPNFDTL